MQQEWVEVRGPSVEEAVQAGLDELGISSADQAEIEVIQEPKRRFMVRVQDAVVRIKAKPATKKRRRRRRKGGRGGEPGTGGEARTSGGSSGAKGQQRTGGGGGGGERGSGRPKRDRSEDRRQQRGGGGEGAKAKSGGESRGAGRRKQERNEGGSVAASDEASQQESAQPAKPDPADQADVVVAFLRGLLEAFGLEGSVSSRVEDGVIFVDVTGEQTEALVGPKGAIMQAIHELSRTVVQRKTFGSARLRLDIAGYGARRHKALEIYAARLAEQIKQDGEEVMLEPMNPADRKVVHDAIADVEGVRTYSEGEEPNRSVIIGLAPGFEPSVVADPPAVDADEGAADDEDAVDGESDGSDSESE